MATIKRKNKHKRKTIKIKGGNSNIKTPKMIRILAKIFKLDDEFNTENITYIKSYTRFLIPYPNEQKFNEEQTYIINKLIQDIMKDKFIGNYNKHINKNNIFLEDNESTNEYMQKALNFIEKFNSDNEIIEELYKRIDIYGIGTILFYCVNQFIKHNKNLDKKQKDQIIDVFEIIRYCCVTNFNVKHITIDKVINDLTSNKIMGGAFFSEGSYGRVFGIPRLPCVGEDISDKKILKKLNGEVSKVFFDDKESKNEYDVINRLKKYMPEKAINELRNYAILPDQLCDVDISQLNHSPYNNKDYLKSFSKNGEDDKKGLTGFKKQVTYDMGGMNLHDVFKSQEDPSLSSQLNHIVNICRGVSLLHHYGYSHGDIKDVNCISVDGTYKLIDMASVIYIKINSQLRKHNIFNFSKSFMYNVYPSLITAMLALIDDHII